MSIWNGKFKHAVGVHLQVKGQRIDVNSKIRTRARAKEQAEQWQMVPLPAKLIALLADSVSESAGEFFTCLHSLHAFQHECCSGARRLFLAHKCSVLAHKCSMLQCNNVQKSLLLPTSYRCSLAHDARQGTSCATSQVLKLLHTSDTGCSLLSSTVHAYHVM